ncbi:hypothetical protein LINGRAHAP2_LOCUS8064 [Linum grandiflorum]
MEVYLNSSANDVWGAVIAGTTVFPKAIRGLYQQIKSVDGDGYTAGSMRTITFGHRKYPIHHHHHPYIIMYVRFLL